MKNISHRQKFLEGKDIIKTVKTEDDNQAAASNAPSARSNDQNDEEMEDADVLGTPPLFGSQSPPSAIQQQEAQHPQTSSGSSSAAAAASGHTEPPPCLSHLPPSFPSVPVSRPPQHAMSLQSSSQQSFTGGGSQGSQFSMSSTQPFLSSTFEVLQIQLRKTFSNQPH